MDVFRIIGGKPLKGTIEVSGSKNTASKLMVASLLTPEVVTIKNVPRQSETALTFDMLTHVGVTTNWEDAHTLRLQASNVNVDAFKTIENKNRIGILLLAPFLHRTGEAFVPVAKGGDKIGKRSVDFHIEIFRRMGVVIEETAEGYRASIKGRLSGAKIELPYPSVGATETALLAGVLASGRTIIHNAAQEPEVLQLIMMLQKMGAIVQTNAGRMIEIIGVESLRGCEMTVIPDRLEAASYASMALATHGEIFVKGAVHEQMMTYLNMVRKIGGQYEVHDDGILFSSSGNLKGIELETDTHPGFMSDWQQPFLVVLTQANGTSVVHETVYENRLGYTKVLQQMGADITLSSTCLGETSCRFKGENFSHSALIKGPSRLKGLPMHVPDIRAGLALVVAALTAEGESTLTGIDHLDRGYERLEEKLLSVGADVKRMTQ